MAQQLPVTTQPALWLTLAWDKNSNVVWYVSSLPSFEKGIGKLLSLSMVWSKCRKLMPRYEHYSDSWGTHQLRTQKSGQRCIFDENVQETQNKVPLYQRPDIYLRTKLCKWSYSLSLWICRNDARVFRLGQVPH